ncbi:MAG: PAS domain-containing protein [Candidatus Latescibacterota bacterium]|jgi:PAS domain-containing protein
MGFDQNALKQAEGLLSLFKSPQADVQKQVLGEYLKNPFLDDDVQMLALRTGIDRAILAPVLAELRDAGFLQSAGRRGHMLDLQQVEATPETKIAALSTSALEDELAAEVPDLALAPLLDALPCGAALLDYDEGLVQANDAFCEMLDLPIEGLHIAQIAVRLGCDPRVEADGGPIALVLEQGLEVQLRPCAIGEFSGVLAVVSPAAVGWEMVQAQVQIQEDLFAHLREEVAGPAALLHAFLEKPKKADLGAARAAVERINTFIATYMLDELCDEDQVE